MKAFNKAIICVLFLSLPLFSGCEQLLDCAFSVSPKLSDSDLPTAKKGQNYNATITGEVRNDANDDNFNYTFALSGNMPEGIGYSISGRNIHFTGAPLRIGSYTFTVKLTISNYASDTDDERCIIDHNTTRTYRINVTN